MSVYLLIDRIDVFQSSSPETAMHFGDGTSCFSRKGENDRWDEGTCDLFSYSSQTAVP